MGCREPLVVEKIVSNLNGSKATRAVPAICTRIVGFVDSSRSPSKSGTNNAIPAKSSVGDRGSVLEKDLRSQSRLAVPPRSKGTVTTDIGPNRPFAKKIMLPRKRHFQPGHSYKPNTSSLNHPEKPFLAGFSRLARPLLYLLQLQQE